jgi:hypothetical protein
MDKKDWAKAQIGRRVIVDPRQIPHYTKYPKHFGGREGVIVGLDGRGTGAWPVVEFDLIGRERKKKKKIMPWSYLL